MLNKLVKDEYPVVQQNFENENIYYKVTYGHKYTVKYAHLHVTSYLRVFSLGY